MLFLTDLRPTSPLASLHRAARAQAEYAARQRQAAQQQAARSEQAATPTFQPRASILENEAGFELRIELPGVDPARLEVTVTGDELVLKGEKAREVLAEGAVWHHQERAFGAFERVFRLPSAVDREAISAESAHGVLTIRLAKAKESLPHRVTITTR